MPTRQEADQSGNPYRMIKNVRTGQIEIVYLTAEEIAARDAEAARLAAEKAARAPNRDEAIDALLQKEARSPGGDATVKAYISSLE